MNRFLKTGIAAISLTFLFSVFTVGEANAQGILGEILARMDKHSKSLSSLKSDLRMLKKNPQIGETDTYQGSLTFLPKTSKNARYARMDWEKPRVESIAVRGETFESYVPALKTITTGKASGMTKPGGALSLLSMSKVQLKANYVIEYLGQEGVSGASQTWHLKLTPKKANGFKSSDIWIDGDGMPVQVMDTEQNNSTTTMLLTGVKKNESIKGSIFKIEVPPGTKKVKG